MIIAISGRVGCGKSTVASAILANVNGVRFSTREMILKRKVVGSIRTALQEAGDDLDRETGFRWVADGVADGLRSTDVEFVVVDAVRRVEQVAELRKRFPDRVRHIHLIADPALLASRHETRERAVEEPGSYDQVQANLTEASIDRLADTADVVFDASRLDPLSMASVALAGTSGIQIGSERLVDVVVGGQYGSEGKGNVCSYLASRYDVLVRVGGPNAGHRVRDPDYDFVHLPSGSLHNRDARLLIGPGTTISLEVLLREIEEVDASDRLSIDPQAIVIEAEDVAIETGSLDAIGSTKKGVGVATARKILNRGQEPVFGSSVRLARDCPELAKYVRSTWVELEKAYADGERVMLEGTQGTDLSVHHGMWPYVTSRETTASGCMADAGVPPARVDRVIMVVRTYPIRVGGTSGYMGRETGFDVIANRSGLDEGDIRGTEVGTVSKKPRRVAEFDLGQVRRAAALNGATEIALTFADYIDSSNASARTMEDLSERTRALIRSIEDATGVPVFLVASGPRREQMIEREGL